MSFAELMDHCRKVGIIIRGILILRQRLKGLWIAF